MPPSPRIYSSLSLAIGLEAVSLRLEAFTSRLEAIAIRLEAIAGRFEALVAFFDLVCSRKHRASLSNLRLTLAQHGDIAALPRIHFV